MFRIEKGKIYGFNSIYKDNKEPGINRTIR
jgi:hypothetical protein